MFSLNTYNVSQGFQKHLIISHEQFPPVFLALIQVIYAACILIRVYMCMNSPLHQVYIYSV